MSNFSYDNRADPFRFGVAPGQSVAFPFAGAAGNGCPCAETAEPPAEPEMRVSCAFCPCPPVPFPAPESMANRVPESSRRGALITTKS